MVAQDAAQSLTIARNQGRQNVFMFGNGTVAHEMFHLFGFNHSPNDWRGEHDYWRGYCMSLRLNGVYVDEEDVGVAFEDVDALRCIFPEGG